MPRPRSSRLRTPRCKSRKLAGVAAFGTLMYLSLLSAVITVWRVAWRISARGRLLKAGSRHHGIHGNRSRVPFLRRLGPVRTLHVLVPVRDRADDVQKFVPALQKACTCAPPRPPPCSTCATHCALAEIFALKIKVRLVVPTVDITPLCRASCSWSRRKFPLPAGAAHALAVRLK